MNDQPDVSTTDAINAQERAKKSAILSQQIMMKGQELHQRLAQLCELSGGMVDPTLLNAQIYMQGMHLEILTNILINARLTSEEHITAELLKRMDVMCAQLQEAALHPPVEKALIVPN